jgi:phosphatidyl-myo-inositol dimannoside synthase
MQPKRVLGLFPRFGHAYLGGIQESARAAWAVIAANAEAQLLCYGRSETGRLPLRDSRLRAILAARSIKPNVDLAIVWQIGLLKLLPFFSSSPRKVALFLHGIEAWKEQDFLTQRLCKRVDVFWTNSDYTWRRFISSNSVTSDRSHRTLALGLGQAVAPPKPPSAEPPIALMVGRLMKKEDYKGHRELINAWPLVLARIPSAELWIAGDGDLSPKLKTLAKQLGVSHKVKFWGKVSEEQKERLIGLCRCLALPSRAEGFGLVYLEAMRLGRPCLVSNLDAGREVINPPEAGLAANPDNPEDLAEAICRLISDGEEWEQWSERARKRYQASFTLECFQQRLLSELF